MPSVTRGFVHVLLHNFLYAYNFLRLNTCCVLLHVCNYSIAHRIHCLKYVLDDLMNPTENVAIIGELNGHHSKYELIFQFTNLNRMRRCFKRFIFLLSRRSLAGVEFVNKAFNVLCRAGSRLSNAFSTLGFWLVVFFTTRTVWDGFVMFSSMTNETNGIWNLTIGHTVFWFLYDIFLMAIVCYSADLPVHQVETLCFKFLAVVMKILFIFLGLQIKTLRQRLIASSPEEYSDLKNFQVSCFDPSVDCEVWY